MIWSLEWRAALAARRLFALNTGVPFALVAAVALGGAPRVHAAMVYTLLIAFFGTFGGAIPLVRDAESGLFGRLVLAGVPQLCPLFPNIDCNTVFQNNVGQQVDPSITNALMPLLDELHF